MTRLLVLLFCVLCVTLPTWCKPTDTFNVSGVVVDQSGKPVAGAKVHVLTDSNMGLPGPERVSEVAKPVTAGKDGSFLIRSLALLPYRSGYYFIAYEKSRYLGWTRDNGGEMRQLVRQVPGMTVHTRVVVTRFGTHEGRIADGEGAPVEGATVTLFGLLSDPIVAKMSSINYWDLPFLPAFKPSVTDARGTYQLTGVPLGARVGIRATKPGFGGVVDAWQDPTMAPGGSLSGRVVDRQGRGVAGAVLNVSGPTTAVVTTSQDGQYRVDDMAPGKYYYLQLEKPFTLVAAAIENVAVKAHEVTKAPDMVVTTGVFVVGRVFDEQTGKPVEGALIASDTAARLGYPAESDPNGRYRLLVRPGKSCKLTYCGGNPLYIPDYSTPKATANVPESGSVNVDIRLRKGKIASGVVLDESGKPVAGAKVTVGAGTYNSDYSDLHGKFHLAVWPERRFFSFGALREGGNGSGDYSGKFDLRAENETGDLGVVEQVDASLLFSNQLLVRLKPIQALKVVVTDKTGSPIPDTRVRLHISSIAFSSNTQAWRTTNSKGEAAFDAVLWGAHCGVVAAKKGYYYSKPERELVHIGDKGWGSTVRIAMDDAKRTQSGRVVDKDGKPVAGATVVARFGFADRSDFLPNAKSDANGGFVITDMPDSSITLECLKDDLRGSASVDKNSGDMVITVKDLRLGRM